MKKLAYKPHIDGIRAIAVGSVVLYHSQLTVLNHQIFKGGFLGVDIFFVISGYLITSIILKELIAKGSFSLKYFYERRIRRILPALLVVILSSLIFALIFLLPTNLIDFSKSILYSLGFSSNFYFHYSGQEYGAQNGLLKPFLHTWSLSVEEQYYILFPIILILSFKFFRKYLIYILILCFLISLGLADWTSRNYPSASFYFIHTRIWEILIGSILAYFEVTRSFRNKNKTLSYILPSFGLLLIVQSIIFFDHEIFHPSFYTLSPVFGVCLIIWFSRSDEIITKVLSTKLLVGVGLISYSLYLWHYPIFAFARITGFIEGNIYKMLLLVFLIMVLSITSYKFIERPFRNKKNSFVKILSLIIVGILIIVTFAVSSIYKSGKLNKFNSFLEKQISSPIYRAECKFSTDNSDFLNLSFFKDEFLNCKKKNKKFILVLGDSHSIDLYNSISKISKKDEFIVGLNRGNCRPLNENTDDCHYKNALKFIKQNNLDIKYIFFTHKGSYFLTNKGSKKQSANSNFRKLPIDKKQVKNTIDYLKMIKTINQKLIFVGPHIEPNVYLNRNSIFNYIKNDKKFVNKSNIDLMEVDNQLKDLTDENNIQYISKIDILEFNFNKDFIIDDNFTFSDTDHWSEFGEIYFGKKLIFKTILKDILFP